MAVSTAQDFYTGDGVTNVFPFTFPYVVQTITTEYTYENAIIRFVTAPAQDAAIRIYRKTSSEFLKAVFFPGSAIRARDLNDNFTQNLYVTQESVTNSDIATDAAQQAVTAATQAAEDAERKLPRTLLRHLLIALRKTLRPLWLRYAAAQLRLQLTLRRLQVRLKPLLVRRLRMLRTLRALAR